MEAYRAIRVLTYCGVEILVHSNLYRGMAGYACGARNPARMDGSSCERSDRTWLSLGSNSAAATKVKHWRSRPAHWASRVYSLRTGPITTDRATSPSSPKAPMQAATILRDQRPDRFSFNANGSGLSRFSKMAKKYRSEAFAAIHETMEGLHEAGAIDKQTMREFSDTAKPAVRAKLPPLVIGNTIGALVSRPITNPAASKKAPP